MEARCCSLVVMVEAAECSKIRQALSEAKEERQVCYRAQVAEAQDLDLVELVLLKMGVAQRGDVLVLAKECRPLVSSVASAAVVAQVQMLRSTMRGCEMAVEAHLRTCPHLQLAEEPEIVAAEAQGAVMVPVEEMEALRVKQSSVAQTAYLHRFDELAEAQEVDLSLS